MGSTSKKNPTANPGLEHARTLPPLAAPVTGSFEIVINSSATASTYIGWAVTACTIKNTDPTQADRNIILKNRDITRGGQVIFRTAFNTGDQATLPLTIPGNGTPVTFYLGGKFKSPSIADQDGGVSVADAVTSAILHQRTLMVRIRKNANKLTIEERDLFLETYTKLNNTPNAYDKFLIAHNSAADEEIHFRPSFLPWHRAFLLDLERQLQALEPAVAIPYWRFDEPAPNVFKDDFMGGKPDGSGNATFTATNHLRHWSVGGGPAGVPRTASFDTDTQKAIVQSEAITLTPNIYFEFNAMEADPHGAAHGSFTSIINGRATATRDPLFFLLHCNVDRLWAKWQLVKDRWDETAIAAYSPVYGPLHQNSTSRPHPPPKPGDQITDTMWPWNHDTSTTRPPVPPGGPFPQQSFPCRPQPLVTLGEMIDYIGKKEGNSNFFDFDDVPFT